METGQILHIVITAIAIIGAGAVALVCDMLKTNNERLRQANMELRVRREEEQRRTELALEQLRRMTELTAERALPPASPSSLPKSSEQRRPAPLLAETAAREQAPRRARRLAAGGPALPAETASVARDHVGETLEEARAVARNLMTANGERSGAVRNSSAPGIPARKNWEMLLKNAGSRRSAATIDVTPVPAGARQRGELIPFESLQSNQDGLHLPPGFHPSGALSHLLDSRTPFRGMVIAIGVNGLNEQPEGEPSAETLTKAVAEYLRTLLEPAEFVCQPGPGRYVLVSQDRDGAAQRRFKALAGKLSNFELRRSPTNALFSYSGFEASGEPLCEAVAAALDRLQAKGEAQLAPALESSRRRKVV
jgi:hypothetical protein